MAEIWRFIDGYEGLYEVSTYGNVRSYKKGKWGISETPKILKGFMGKHYLTVILCKDCKITKYIHRLVAETFIPNPFNLKEVNHIDGNKTNNHISNLEWVSHKENMEHANHTGLASFRRRKIICVETDCIYNSATTASNITGISRRTINNCLRNRSKTAGGYHWEYFKEVI